MSNENTSQVHLNSGSTWKKLTTEKNLKRIFYTFLIGHIPLGLVLALLTSDDILSNPLARYFTDFVANFVPLVRETGRRTTVPATQFIAAVLNIWAIGCGSVFVFLFMEVSEKVYSESINLHKNFSKEFPVKYFSLVVLIPLFCLSFFLLMNIAPYAEGLTMKQKLMLGSKMGMGTYGAGLILSMWLMAVVGLMIIFDTIHFRYRLSLEDNKRHD